MEERERAERISLLRAGAPLLEAWFEQSGRALPWRGNVSPYAVLVSESMLQQTRIDTVLRYFPRFMERFPNPAALAAAPEDEVLKLWEGLGYYSRARNLQKAAKVCVEQYGGKLPETARELKKLPGVGEYTAGAVASLAFGEPAPAVDGNVLRILARFFSDERDVLEKTVRTDAAALLTETLKDRPNPGRFNEALMELGEMLCLPAGRPLCRHCPVRELCQGLACGTESDLPNRGPARPRRIENKTVLVLRCGSRIALEKRPDKGLLAGLYGFPVLDGRWEAADLKDWLRSYGVPITSLKPLEPGTHIFTHVEWHMNGWLAETERPLPGYVYADREEAGQKYALPSAFRVFRRQCFDD